MLDIQRILSATRRISADAPNSQVIGKCQEEMAELQLELAKYPFWDLSGDDTTREALDVIITCISLIDRIKSRSVARLVEEKMIQIERYAEKADAAT